MGKKLRVQRRGRGTTTFRSIKKGKISPVKYPNLINEEIQGIVLNFVHDSGRGSPLAHIELSTGESYYTTAPEGLFIGQEVFLGSAVSLKVGNALPLRVIPEGTMVCNVELKPGDGGRLVRSSGSYATVTAQSNSKTTLRLPSKKSVIVNNNCRATIGIVSGGGRKDKPFVKAGEKYYLKKAKGQVYPMTKGVKMTAASHPHGGGRHRRPGKSTTVSRNAPPGKKVGLIAARNSGKRIRRRRT